MPGSSSFRTFPGARQNEPGWPNRRTYRDDRARVPRWTEEGRCQSEGEAATGRGLGWAVHWHRGPLRFANEGSNLTISCLARMCWPAHREAFVCGIILVRPRAPGSHEGHGNHDKEENIHPCLRGGCRCQHYARRNGKRRLRAHLYRSHPPERPGSPHSRPVSEQSAGPDVCYRTPSGGQKCTRVNLTGCKDRGEGSRLIIEQPRNITLLGTKLSQKRD